jgi:hypothetical protein
MSDNGNTTPDPEPSPTTPNIWKQLGQDIDGDSWVFDSGNSVSLSADGKTVAFGGPSSYDINSGKNALGRVVVYSLSNGSWNQVGQDIDGKEDFDLLGVSVALSADGKTVATGAIGLPKYIDPKMFDAKNFKGLVRIYQLSGSFWTQVGEDIDGENVNDNSGISVSLSTDGKIVAIGANQNTGINGPNSGQVRVYQLSGSSWTQIGQDIDGENVNDNSGISVSLSSNGKIVAIGANENSGLNFLAGQVRVYQISDSEKRWIQLGQDIDGEIFADRSGNSVSLSADGKTVAIGASYSNGKDRQKPLSGEVRVFTLLDSSWTPVGKSIYGESSYDQSGYSVSLSSDGKTVAIGSPAVYNPNENGKSTKSGQVSVYTFSESSWTQVGEDINGKEVGEMSGWSVSLSDDGKIVAFGAPRKNIGKSPGFGQVRVYTSLPEIKPLSDLINDKVSATELIESKITSKELIEAGFTAYVMKEKGYNAKDLKLLDYPVKLMKQAKFTLSSVLRAGFQLRQITRYYKADKFLAIGIDAEKLRVRGISDDRLIKMGFFPLAPK